MKILHTADWHIGQFKGPVVDGVNLRSQDTVKCLEYMVQVAIEEKPDIVCVSGDIFHQEQVGPVRYSDEMITATNIITSLAHFLPKETVSSRQRKAPFLPRRLHHSRERFCLGCLYSSSPDLGRGLVLVGGVD